MHVINPANLSVVKTISEDNEGNPLNNVGSSGGAANMSRSWNDAVLAQVNYMLQLTSETFSECRYLGWHCTRYDMHLQDPSPNVNKSYLFVNEGDVYPGPGNLTHSYVTVIDTSTATVSTGRAGRLRLHSTPLQPGVCLAFRMPQNLLQLTNCMAFVYMVCLPEATACIKCQLQLHV